MASRDNPLLEITPEVLLKAYSCGIFPMAESADDPQLIWIEPQARGLLPLTDICVPKRLARTIRQEPFQIRIDSHFDGVIGLRYVSEGSFINATTRIAFLANLSPIKLEFSVPGKYSSKIKKGDSLVFSTDARDKPYEASVYAVDPQIDPQTRTLKIRAISDNSDGSLLPGQFAKIELVLRQSDDVIMLPTEAVIPQLRGHKIFVYKNGTAEELAVDIGVRTANSVEIASGLNLGDTVITSGILSIKNRSKVEVTTLN